MKLLRSWWLLLWGHVSLTICGHGAAHVDIGAPALQPGQRGFGNPSWTRRTRRTRRGGDPQDDLKLLGSLPPSVVAAALAQARLHDGAPLAAAQAAHVGLVFSLARRILHTLAGGDWDSWTEVTPFADATPPARTQADAAQNPSPDRKLQMTNI